jgi:hypothetical protein
MAHIAGLVKDLVKNGMDVEKIITIQMEKIEEQMLYIIELKKEVDLLKKQVTEFKKSN